MSRVERLARAALLAVAGLSLVVIVVAWVLKLLADAFPEVASLHSEAIFLTTLCSGVAAGCVSVWVWIGWWGLVRAMAAALAAVFMSIIPLAGAAKIGARQGVTTIALENLSYDFLGQHAPFQYTTWSTPPTRPDVEKWQIAQYGFPEPFLHVCDGIQAGGHYVMLDKFRLALDWLLALDGTLIVGIVLTYVIRMGRTARTR